MQIYIPFVILLIQLGLISAYPWTHCYPDRLEGRRFRVETESSTFFAIDFVAQRFYEIEDSTGNVFHVIDFGGGYMISFEDGNCTHAEFQYVQFFNQCITDDFNLPALSLGELNNGVDVASVGYRVHGVDRRVLGIKANDRILPLFKQDVRGDNTTSTSFFYEVTDSISLLGELIGCDTANCETENWAAFK